MQEIAVLDGVVRKRLHSDKGDRYYYFGTMRSDKAKMLTFVPVLDPSPRTYLIERTVDGYQRGGSTARMNLFAQFLKDHPLSVVPPVVISGRGAWKFSGNEGWGTLTISAAAAIIDGQHRLGGYVRLAEHDQDVRDVDFLLLPELGLDEEVNEFLTINNTQKGVRPSLTSYLGGAFEGEDTALIGWELNTREDSPLRGRITRQALGKGQLFNLASVAKNVQRTFSHGAFENVTVDEKVDILVRYWTIIADALPTEWGEIDNDRAAFKYKLLELTGFIAWSWAAEDILGPAFDPATKSMNWDAVEARVDKVAAGGCIDWAKSGEFAGLTGEVGGKRIHKKMQWCLQEGIQTAGDVG